MQKAINPNIWKGKKGIQELKKQHDESGPYLHCVIDELCPPGFLRKIHDELTNKMKANFKETDLFKVFQTAELGAIDEKQLEEEMPTMLALRKALYSAEFRNIVQEITGCGNLIDRVDCSCNAYANSCHLLCHDDVIGTRCISYIIYLPDPDEPWTTEDGGAVELFPLDPASVVNTDAGNQGVPLSLPTKTILPIFNSMLFFAVQPGRSYHAVQEVFSKTRPRLSISGWYHTVDAPVGADRCSLKLIMSYGDAPIPTNPFPFSEEELLTIPKKTFTLTTEELSFLQSWMAPEYLTIQGMKNIQKQFIKQSSIQLSNFLLPKKVNTLLRYQLMVDALEEMGLGKPQLHYEKGLTEAWELIGPPHKRRYLRYEQGNNQKEKETVNGKDPTEVANKVGELMHKITSTFLTSKVFAKYLMIISTLTITGERHEIRRFRTGLDYTVAHFGIITKEPWLDATLCFVNDDKEASERLLQEKKKKNTNKGAGKGEEEGRGSGMKKNKKARKQAEQEQQEEVQEEEVESPEEEGVEEDYATLWEDGEVGGYECFIEADDDADTAEAAEVYQSTSTTTTTTTNATTAEKKGRDEETTLLSVSACNNSLSLVLRDEGIMKFIKYVSANAPSSRWDVSMEYAVRSEEEDDEEEDNEDEDSDDSDEEEDE